MITNKFRTQCRHTLFNPIDFWGKTINGLIAFLIIISISVIPLYFIPEIQWAKKWLFLFEVFTATVFSIEYVFRVWSAEKPLRYAFSWHGIIDIAAIAPFYLEALGMMTGAHYFLILRILRILKLGRIYCTERLSIANIAKKYHGDFHVYGSEIIEHIAQKHPLIFFVSLAPPFIFTSLGLFTLVIFRADIIASAFAVLFFVFAFLFFLKAWFDFHYDVIYITNHRIILQNRQLFGTRLNDIVYDSITNIRPDNTGVFQFLFGFGDIQIETAASSGNRKFSDVSDPFQVVQQISENRQKALNKNNTPKEAKSEESSYNFPKATIQKENISQEYQHFTNI